VQFHSNPTPKNQPINWTPYKAKDQNYLAIDATLTIENSFSRLNQLSSLQKQFTGHL